MDRIASVLAGLREAGNKLWVDVDAVAPGDSFPKEIGEAIARADLFVVFLSPRSVTRPWVLDEISYARRRELRIVPVEVEPVKLPPELEVQIGKRQRVAVAQALEQLLDHSARGVQDEPPNLDGYLTHLTDEWGYVPIDALMKDQASGGIRVENVFVSLATRAPGLRESSTRPDMECLERLTDAEQRNQADIFAALEAVGFSKDRIARLDLVTKVGSRLDALRPDSSESLLRVLETIELEDALLDTQVLLVEGAPGSGKSTTLQHLAISLADALRSVGANPSRARRMGFEPPFPVPIFVPLRRFARWLETRNVDVLDGGHGSLKDYLEEIVRAHADGSEWVERALESGRLLLLLDGLDEIAKNPLRRGVAKVIRDFAKKFRHCRFAVTSRPSGLGSAETNALRCLEGLVHCRVLPLDDAQREAFVRAWYGALRPSNARAEAETEKLIHRLGPIDARDADKGLTRTPVTLVAICIVHASGELPELRVELYERCVQALCGKIDTQYQEDGADADLAGMLNRDQKLQVLQALAFAVYQEEDEDARVERPDLLGAVQEALREAGHPHDSEATERELRRLTGRTGILVPDDVDDFRFLHKTFLEYLTARHICRELDEDPAEFLGARLSEPWWDEVIRLAVAYAKLQGRSGLFTLVRGLEKQVTGAAERRAAASGTLGRAMLDLRAYGVRKIEQLAKVLEPRFLEAAKDRNQSGQLADRVAALEAMALYRPDPRIGWSDKYFPLVERRQVRS